MDTKNLVDKRNPWIIACIALIAALIVMSFGLGYLLATSKARQAVPSSNQSAAQDSQSNSANQTIDLSQLKKTLNSDKNKPTIVNDEGGILFSRNGYGETIDNVPTVSLYEEPMCPYCGMLNRQIDSTIMKLYEAGQINIDLHWLNFLDQASTDNYSNRAAGGMIYIAEHDSNPQHLLTFISAIYDESFQPHEGASYKPVSNDQLEEQAVKAGVSSDVASQAFDKGIDYQSWLTAATAYTANRTDLHDGNGKFATPTVTINGTFWDATALMSQNQDMNGMLLKAIGLNPNKLGVDGVKPSLGEKKTTLN